MKINVRLELLHRSLMNLQEHQKNPSPQKELCDIFDEFDCLATEVLNEPWHSCPFCHHRLRPFEEGEWICRNISAHGGMTPIFREGSKSCKFASTTKPFCNYHGECLWKVYIGFGKPPMCKHGKLDAQSPKE